MTTTARNNGPVTTMPWGATGQDVKGKFKPVAQVMKEHGLDWTVDLEPTFLADGTEVPHSFVTRRNTDGKILGVVGKRYTPVQNVDAFGFFDSFVENKQASITTVGQFKEGRVLFLQAEVAIDPVEIVKGYDLKSFITLGHAHDGSLKILCGFTPVNMFCMNQMANLKKSSGSKLLSMKHTKNAIIGLEAIKGIMDVHRQEFNLTAEQYKFLASKPITKKGLEALIKASYAKSGEDECTKTIDTVTHLFETGIGLGGKEMKNYYGAYNAITEQQTWHAGRTTDNRLQSLWFGEAQQVIQKAFDTAILLASGKPVGRA